MASATQPANMDGNHKVNKKLVSDSNGKQHCLRILLIRNET